MSKYQIWDKESDVITPSMQVYTAEQWKKKYPVASIDAVKIVISGGTINGAFIGIFDSMVESAQASGCDFSNCKTDQDYLDAIEAFQKASSDSSSFIDPQERIAAALEAQVLMALPDEEA